MALNYAKKFSRKSSIIGEYYYEQPQKAKKHVNDDNHDDICTSFKKLILELFEDALQDANSVITTCYNAANDTLRIFTQPTIVVVDEAGAAIELETLMITNYDDLGWVIMVIFLSHHRRHCHRRRLHRRIHRIVATSCLISVSSSILTATAFRLTIPRRKHAFRLWLAKLKTVWSTLCAQNSTA